MKWCFLACESLLSSLFYLFFSHTHHTTYSGMHWLLVTTQENERKVRKSLRKRRKTCVTIIVGNRTRNLSIGNRCTYHCTIWDTHTHTHTHTHTYLYLLLTAKPGQVGLPGRGERETQKGSRKLAIEPTYTHVQTHAHAHARTRTHTHTQERVTGCFCLTSIESVSVNTWL